MMLEPRDPVLYFVQRLRDEAHRFAIGTHRAKRGKSVGANPLDEIAGIGPPASAPCSSISARPRPSRAPAPRICRPSTASAPRWRRPSTTSSTSDGTETAYNAQLVIGLPSPRPLTLPAPNALVRKPWNPQPQHEVPRPGSLPNVLTYMRILAVPAVVAVPLPDPRRYGPLVGARRLYRRLHHRLARRLSWRAPGTSSRCSGACSIRSPTSCWSARPC